MPVAHPSLLNRAHAMAFTMGNRGGAPAGRNSSVRQLAAYPASSHDLGMFGHYPRRAWRGRCETFKASALWRHDAAAPRPRAVVREEEPGRRRAAQRGPFRR